MQFNPLRLLQIVLICHGLLGLTDFSYGSEKQTAATDPDTSGIVLSPAYRIDFEPINESSSLIKSRLWPNVFWTLNDSGDRARIFPITPEGTEIKPKWTTNYQGIEIPDAVNVDWEAITTDDAGNLYIGDIGNNSNTRRDLAIYRIPEPYPTETVTTRITDVYFFQYPDQDQFPPQQMNFDAEAMFWREGKIYILTKHRSDTFTRMYCLDTLKTGQNQLLRYLDQFDIKDMVTDADISPDGREMVVLTYSAIWLFKRQDGSDQFFKGEIYRLPISAGQCEAICFADNQFIISNENRQMFVVPRSHLIPYVDSKK